MKILVLGGGGREHALVWKLKQSARVEKIWCAPGNGGIAAEAECVAIDASDVAAIVAFAEKVHPDLTIVGPELPLVNGLTDAFRQKRRSSKEARFSRKNFCSVTTFRPQKCTARMTRPRMSIACCIRRHSPW